MFKMKHLGIIVVVLTLAGCGGADDRRAAYLKRAEGYFAAKDYEKARVEYKNALQIDPSSSEGYLGLAKSLEKLENWRQAAGYYLKAIELDPESVEARVQMGEIYLLAGQLEKVQEMADAALELDAKDLDGLILRAALHNRKNESEAALRDVETALGVSPGYPNALSVKSSLLLKQGRTEAAIATLRDGMAKNPKHPGMPLLLAQVLLKEKRSAEAVEVLRTSVAREPAALRHRLRLARVLGTLNRIDEAQVVLEKGIHVDPENQEIKLAVADFVTRFRGVDAAEKLLLAYMEEEPTATFRLKLASIYERSRRLEQAKGAYRDLVELEEENSPTELLAKTRLARVIGAEGNLAEAKRLVNEVISVSRRDKGALTTRGRISLAQRDPLSAIADFRTVLADYPDDADVRRFRAVAHALNNEPDQAVSDLRQILDANAKDVRSRVLLAQLLAGTGDTVDAKTIVESGLKGDPDQLALLELLSRIELSQRNWAAAKSATDRIKAAYPERASAFYLAGLSYMGQKQFDASEEQLRLALKHQPEAMPPLTALVRVYLTQGAPDKAEAVLSEKLKAKPEDPATLNLLGEIMLVQRKTEDAEDFFAKATEVRPDWSLPYRNLGLSRLAEGDTHGAIDAYRAGAESTGSDSAFTFGIASLYERRNEPENAIKQYEELLAKNPSSEVAANNLAMLLVTYRSDKASVARAASLVERFAGSRDANYLDTVGWVRLKQGELEEATIILQRVVQIAPKSPVFNYHLGMAYYSDGKSELARQYLETAVRGNTSFKGVDEARATLKAITTPKG